MDYAGGVAWRRPFPLGELYAVDADHRRCGHGSGAGAASPAPGTTRTDLQRHDLSVPGWEMLQALVNFAPGASFPRHKHPGEEIIYVTQGTIEYEVAGKPVTVKAGEVLFIPTAWFTQRGTPAKAPPPNWPPT